MGSLLQCEDTGLPIDVPCSKPESAEDVTVYTTTACTTAVCSARQPALEINRKQEGYASHHQLAYHATHNMTVTA